MPTLPYYFLNVVWLNESGQPDYFIDYVRFPKLNKYSTYLDRNAWLAKMCAVLLTTYLTIRANRLV